MKINKMFSLIYFGLLFIAACDKQQTDFPDDNSDDTIPDIIVNWKIPLLEDTSEASVADPLLYEDIILFGGFPVSGSGGRIAGYNVTTNEIIWMAACDLNTGQSSSTHFENIFVGLDGSEFKAFDLNNGNIVWTSPYEGSYKITHFENKIFSSHKMGGTPALYSYLVMADINTGIWDTVYTTDLSGGFGPNNYPPGVMVNAENDTILYFQNRQYNYDDSEGKIDLYAFDMTNDSILWIQYDIDPDGNSSVQPPLVYNDKIYFRGNRILFCLDAQNGNMIWQKEMGADEFEDLLSGNTLIADGKVIVKTGGYSLYALNPDSGSEIWVNTDAGPTPSDMIFYNGAVYYGSGGDGMIHVIDIETGEPIIEFESPMENSDVYPNAGFYDAVAIDPVSNLLYAADGYFLYCIAIDW